MHPNENVRREGRQHEVDAGSVTTEQLTNGVAGDGNTISRILGVGSGDVVLVASYLPRNRTFSSSNSSYTDSPTSNISSMINWDHLTVLNGTPVIGLMNRNTAGTDEEVFQRVKNFTDGEAVTGTEISTTETSISNRWSGWAEYSPTSSGPLWFGTQHKTDPGTNSSTFRDFEIVVGVKL